MEGTQQVSDQTQQISDSAENNSENLETKGKAKYSNDLVRYKQQAKELQDRLAEYEMKEQQKQGNYESVIAKLKSDLSLAKKEAQELKVNFASARLDEAIKVEAINKGIKGQQLDAFMRLIDKEAKGAVEFDNSFNINSADVSNIVDDHLKRYSEVFKRPVKVADATPNGKPINNDMAKPFDISKASSADIVAYLKANKDKLK